MALPDIATCRQQLRQRADHLAQLPRLWPGPPDEDTLAYAEEIVAGSLRFGGRSIEVGRRGIDWTGGHCHHQEWPTQMGRFILLKPLMQAYLHNADERCAEAARDYIADWLDQVDPGEIEARGNTCMDIGIRLGTHGFGGWGAALGVFLDSPAWDDPFLERVLDSCARQVEILWQRGVPSRPTGNHRIFGLEGLLWTGVRLPFLPKADEFMAFARLGLRHAFLRQFLPEGIHLERNVGYHQHMVEIYVWLNLLARIDPEAAVDIPPEWLAAALDYPLHTLPAGINDTAAVVDDPTGEDEWATAREWREWLLDTRDDDWAPPIDVAYHQAGLVFARAHWQPGADYLAFDAAGYGGAHCHLARLGLVWRSGGRLWVADPGNFGYEMSDPFAVHGRSTPAHSTLNIDGLNQGIADAQLTHSVINDELVFLRGTYQGSYWDGAYTWGYQQGVGAGVHGQHERMVLWVRGRYLLVFDSLRCDPGHTIENVWQLAPAATWSHDPEQLTWRSGLDGANLHLQLIQAPDGTTMDVYEGSEEPLRGWFNTRQDGRFTPAPQVVYRYPSCGSAVTLILPFDGPDAPAPKLKHPSQAPGGHVQYFELLWPDGRYDCIGWSPWLSLAVDSHCPLTSDAPFVWYSLPPDDSPERIFLLDGSFLNHLGYEVYRGDPLAWHWV